MWDWNYTWEAYRFDIIVVDGRKAEMLKRELPLLYPGAMINISIGRRESLVVRTWQAGGTSSLISQIESDMDEICKEA